MVDFAKYLKVKVDPLMPSNEVPVEQNGRRVGTIVNIGKEDPKPELSMRTLQINLELAHRRVMAAQQTYSAAYIEWLLISEQIRERLADEHRRNNNV